jgi:hypothetical protein
MRLTSTGLGIGTSSPAGKLHVQRASAGTLFYGNDGVSAGFTISTSGFNAVLDSQSSAGGFVFTKNAGASTQMTLDSAGNLGLGVTPSAWSAQWKTLQIGQGHTALVGRSDAIATYYGSNWLYDGADKYIANGFASIYSQQSGQHSWSTAPSGTAGNAITFTQAMTLDASGNLLVGYTSGGDKLTVNGNINSRNTALFYGDGADNSATLYSTSGPIKFAANAAERARITAGGYSKFSDNGTYINSTGTAHEFNQSANNSALQLNSTNASMTSDVLYLQATRNTTNNTYYAIGFYNSTAAVYRFQVADSGNVTNTNGSYGTISDAKMKTDIVDAGSQWADIKAVRFRKFKMKDDPQQITQLGVVAQELEQTSPGLVDEHADRDAEGNDLGTTTKSVKSSILLMKAAVALQEAMARIEQLEADVAALKGN